MALPDAGGESFVLSVGELHDQGARDESIKRRPGGDSNLRVDDWHWHVAPSPWCYRLRTPYKRPRKGICSSWLASLEPGAEVPLSIRPGTFKLPESWNHPVIMVGPGTGIAPIRSVILERRRQRGDKGLSRLRKETEGVENDVGKTGAECGDSRRLGEVAPDTLFLGCR